MKVYVLVILISAMVTYLFTPFARWLALRIGAVTAVRARDVHSIPTPRLGGAAMLVGVGVSFVFASQIPFCKAFSRKMGRSVRLGFVTQRGRFSLVGRL